MPYTSYGLLKAIRSHQVSSPSVTSSLETGRPNACNQCHLDRTLAWSAAALERWYGIPQPTLDGTERGVPASLVWLLSGDAGQRALMAWTMGWEPALEISGEHWTTPYLTQLLADPYDAVRLIAERSLRRRPGFEEMDYDFLAPPRARVAAAAHIRQHWIGLPAPPGEIRDARSLLDDPDRTLPDDVFSRLLAERDDRVVILTE
jgi:hypothetical protein